MGSETKKIKKNALIVLVGPTAVGKTELSIRLAQHYQTVIVSADSRQFYREMTIGTAKPTPAEMQGVPHYFINSHTITQEYNAGTYEQDVLRLLNQLFLEHTCVILTGGSGLYVRAVLEGMDEMPEVPAAIREKLNLQKQEQGLEALLQQLQQLDPVYYNQVDRANAQRVIRALEVTLATNQPYSTFRKKQAIERPFQILRIGLNRERSELYHRIDRRIDHMLEAGLLPEVKQLEPYKAHNALQTVGYQELFAYLEGKYDWEEAVRLLKRNSRRYAKRQLTWFTKNNDFTWFHPQEWEALLQFIEQRMS
ncbi:tRNA (adenosine(37)-N6)-dimethylallyltransferase MiaA [Adhaeribacter pallidiroseus]|uniref:tRNA dimethylallyltransferase n=1 Tax=Adhaeribacter pallidiroseus TaxID=2072847 RepID=A0A369QPN9_9BACT|nr:tRNA (adenosine(37)-N6)-dimethylallyltransferase MiaA [Adhaeribacter pallidiroseus]RDC64178.1 Adenylate isopentenyltransferase 1, chloroplastic [Adhaeribacter pallidiroseus]